MRREILAIFILLCMMFGLFSLFGCSEDDEEGYEAAPELITESRGFGFGLLYELYQEEGRENIFISPLSVSLALAMTYNGAAGETQKAMAETLDLTGMPLAEVNGGYADLQEKPVSSDPEVEIAIVNSMWAHEGREFYDDFMERNRRFYNAEVDTLDFGDPQSVIIINDWVNIKTNKYRGRTYELKRKSINGSETRRTRQNSTGSGKLLCDRNSQERISEPD